jgi:hypothetical protein
LGHGLGSFNNGLAWRARLDPGAQGQDVDAFLGAESGHRDIDDIEQLRRFARNNSDNGTTTANAGINPKIFTLRSRGTSVPLRCWRDHTNQAKGIAPLVLRPLQPSRLHHWESAAKYVDAGETVDPLISETGVDGVRFGFPLAALGHGVARISCMLCAKLIDQVLREIGVELCLVLLERPRAQFGLQLRLGLSFDSRSRS